MSGSPKSFGDIQSICSSRCGHDEASSSCSLPPADNDEDTGSLIKWCGLLRMRDERRGGCDESGSGDEAGEGQERDEEARAEEEGMLGRSESGSKSESECDGRLGGGFCFVSTIVTSSIAGVGRMWQQEMAAEGMKNVRKGK